MGPAEGEGSIYDDINQVLNVLPQLNTGLNVDPLFLHDNDARDDWFENEQHDLAIFKIFDIKLVHGWLMDPAALSDYKTVKNKIRSFDNYQLVSLRDQVTLDTPGGNADDDSSLIDGNLVWQSLSSVTGDLDMFYDENFQLSTSDGTHVNNNSASTGEAVGAGGDVDSVDLKLAQSLQLQEDEILAREFEQQRQQQQQQRQQQQQQQQQQRRTQERQGQTIGQATGGTGNLRGKRNSTNLDGWQGKKDKDKKCIIC
ncbi:hypothetical protein D0Z00_001690 [Geotrichum galactomycetum]|uniref:Uncharacterized protein n=1 Tax=Geotrichum galactomycetum TaxID=27317 RepID=A0ACB6V655_9ASCO|nr:hypothetical protein D0Z00_001690 [Geotrichum candidum]